jgi:hypothetical protein
MHTLIKQINKKWKAQSLDFTDKNKKLKNKLKKL